MVAKISYFYGISPVDIDDMENDRVMSLWDCITIIEAQEQLKMLSALDWPNMKKSQRTNFHKELFKKAYPSEIRKKNYVSIDDLKKLQGV